MLYPLDVFIKTGYREAAFLHGFALAIQNLNLWVNKHPRFSLVVGQVHNDDLLVHVHLRSGQANAGRIVHGLEHVVDQRKVSVRQFINRLGDGAQTWVRVFENV